MPQPESCSSDWRMSGFCASSSSCRIETGSAATQPKRIWWARPGKLCGMERPGGGGRSHRPERRDAEIAHLRAKGVRLCVSTMGSRHNLGAYEAAGLGWHHVPVESAQAGADAL